MCGNLFLSLPVSKPPMENKPPQLESWHQLKYLCHLFPYVCLVDDAGNISLWKVKSLRAFKNNVGVCILKTPAKTVDEVRQYLPVKSAPVKKYPVPAPCDLFHSH